MQSENDPRTACGEMMLLFQSISILLCLILVGAGGYLWNKKQQVGRWKRLFAVFLFSGGLGLGVWTYLLAEHLPCAQLKAPDEPLIAGSYQPSI